MTIKSLIGAGLLLIALPAHAEVTRVFNSEVYRAGTDELVYTERHEYQLVNGQPDEAKVTYFSPQGEVVAIKRLDFEEGAAKPFFTRQNMVNGVEEGFSKVEDGPEGELFRKNIDGSRDCGDRMVASDNMVIDAGFNQLLKQNLDVLAKGQAIAFDLLIPKACRAIGFKVEPLNSYEDDHIRLALKPQNFFFRMMVPETELIYSRTTGELVYYRGLSDLTDEQGRTMHVDIRFDQPVVTQALGEVNGQ